MASHNVEDWQSTKRTVLERNSYMFNNPLMSDVTFTCGDSDRKYFYAHTYVLATSSPVFYAMFYGDLAETNPVIHLPDANEEGLEAFLRFLYQDENPKTLDLAIKVIYLAKKYMVSSLAEKCWELIDTEVSTVIKSEAFLDISQDTLEDILKRDTLNIPGDGEVALFQAILKWCDHQCSVKGLEPNGENRRAALGDAVHQIRFLSMSQEEFANNVSTSGLLTDTELVAAFQKFSGMPGSCLACSLPRRKGTSKSCIRFSQHDIMRPTSNRWSYSRGYYDCLQFTVDKPALFYGVRLFGNVNDGIYKVTMICNNTVVNGTYTSTYKSERLGKCLGFDVKLPEPCKVFKYLTTKLAILINGPKSYYGRNGKSVVEVDGVRVNFSNYQNPHGKSYNSNGTDVTRGQIYELIISHDDKEEN